ncbi:AAA family ATPase [Kocuria sp. WN036]|uniref:AAA family ATPase n=1 Tax=Kocuria sp. WN036 TaxID=2032628 RepID=UPI001595B4F7|nr:AAA family ATPase [Kocuria sp. WN036]
MEYDYASGVSYGESQISAYYLDPAKSALQSLTVVEGDPNFRDLIEGVDSYEFSDDMRSAAAYVIGREYESVAIYEIEEMGDGNVPLPFFEVVSGGLKYDSMGMGRGELNVIYLLWFLSYIDRGSVVLIEEPEAHLAQYSQGNLVNALAVIRKDKNLQLIVSSHYPGFFESLPAGSLHSVTRLPHFRLQPIVDVYEYARRLGAVQRVSTAVLVEDVVASAFLRELIQVFDPGLMHKLAIVPVGLGESGIFRFIDSIQNDNRHNLHFMGVLDGDCRGKNSYITAGLLFLPGSSPPEELVKNALQSWRDSLAPHHLTAGISTAKMHEILEDAQGLEIHDWFRFVADKSGGQGQLLALCVRLMNLTEEFADQAQELISAIRSRTV